MTLDEIRTRLEALGVQVGSTFLTKTDAGVLLAVQIGALPEQWTALLAGPALTPAEVDALTWAAQNAKACADEAVDASGAKDWTDHAAILQGLLDRDSATKETPTAPDKPEGG